METFLGTSSVNDLIGMFESWEKVQELAAHLSGVKAQLLDTQCKVISGREALPDFCRLIQSSKIGEARCRGCYEKSALSANAAKKPANVFICHAGLDNIAFPLTVEGRVAGAVVCGRTLNPETRPDNRAFQNLAGELGIDVSDLELAISSLHVADPSALAAYAKVLKPFIDVLGATIFRYFSLLEKSEALIEAAKESENQLSVDLLTGLFNRKYFDSRLAAEVSRAIRYRHPLTLVIIELDGFDIKTDGYGLAVKDIVLKEAADEIIGSARQAEVAARYDNSRFAIIMPECDHEQAFRLADRIRKNIAVKPFGRDSSIDIQLTASFGVTAMYEDMSSEKLIEKAEQMLSQAKSDGGNKIRLNPMRGVVTRDKQTPYVYVPNATKKRRVVITGLGPIAPNGIGKDAFWEGIKNGKSGIRRITQFDSSSLPIQIAAEVDGFVAEDHINPREARRIDRFAQFAIVASRMAIEDAALDLRSVDKSRIGVATGTAIGGFPFGAKQNIILHTEGYKKMSPFLAMALVFGASSSQVSIDLGIFGPSTTFSTGCNSGADAATYAYDLITRGDLDAMIVGGTDACIIETVIAAFAHLRALSARNDEPEKASRPFDLERDGFVLGEAAGFLVVEEMEHALRRNAHIYCEIQGYGMTCDAFHMTRPDPEGEGMYQSMKMALERSGLSTSEVDYINAHGSSTPLNDMTETKAIKRLFKDNARNLCVSSTKSMIGHSVGAPGAVELIITALALKNNFLPPTINYEVPDPDCDLDYVPNIGRSQNVNVALSNSFSFGGKNTVLAVTKFKEKEFN